MDSDMDIGWTQDSDKKKQQGAATKTVTKDRDK
jgi:hypothetical protein